MAILMANSSYTTDSTNSLTWYASGNGGAVAAGQPASAQAGIEILRQGGNAVDGAVAVIFCLAVSDYGSFCIGGEVPFIFFNSNTGKVSVFNGMGGAPGDQDAINWCYLNGIPDQGIKASTVPSAVSTCLTALELNGTMTFGEVIAPALALLDTGKETWYANLAVTLRKLIATENSTAGTREQKIRKARDRFYKGDIADELNDYYIRSGGFLRKGDLEAHMTLVEEPVSIDYRDYTIYKCNTWTQGPVLLQSLRLLENFDLKSMGHLKADYIHVTAEAMKLAYADRDKYYGDPAYVDVPLQQLLSDKYTAVRWPLIDMNQASQIIRPGNPYDLTAFDGPGLYWGGGHGTTNCIVVDKWGNVVAATPSSNTEYGVCESLGIAHNTRLSSLNTQKGHPNALQAGKRPRITLTPTIVVRNGKPVIAISVAGGDWQDQVSLQLFLDIVEFGMMPKEAILSPRFQTYHVENSFNPSADPGSRLLNMGVLGIYQTNQAEIEDLRKRGHKIEMVSEIARPVMVYIDQESGIVSAAGEPGYKHCAAINAAESRR
jgi:gamma-glutamyltranspeptidase/glutathione hydrolase